MTPACRRRIVTTSREETLSLGRWLGSRIPPGTVLGLVGDLGMGKTVLVQGLAQGLGVDPRLPVASPTFTIVNVYPGRTPLSHIDLYRIETMDDLLGFGFDDYLEGGGVTAVEWFDRLDELGFPPLPHCVRIEIGEAPGVNGDDESRLFDLTTDDEALTAALAALPSRS